MPKTIDLLTTLDAARIADVGPATIRLWRRSGRLVPAVCAASGLALYARGDVERVAAERRTEREARQREQRHASADAAEVSEPAAAVATGLPSIIVIVLTLLALWPSSSASQGTPIPWVRPQYLDDSGNPCSGCKLSTYAAGTTTAQPTYTTITLTPGTENTNPIVMNSAGRPGYIYLSATSYRFVLTDSTGATTYWDSDNTPAIPSTAGNTDITNQTAGVALSAGDLVYLSDGSNSLTAGRWYKADSDFYYASIHPVLGFVPTAIASGSTGTIRLAGLMTGLTGLTTGTTYYVSSTAGGVTATAPANARAVGQSISATTLAINIASAWILDAGQSLNRMDGRLTLTSATPVTTSDVSAATTLYYTPYTGNRVSLFDGSRWKGYSFSELSLAITCTAAKPYDVFLYDNAGTLTLETLVWTNTTTRATALVTQDGVLEKTGALTRRYVGSFYCNSSGNQTDDTLAKRYVYNYYNRKLRPLSRLETTATWTYTTATIRQANGAAANQLEIMNGWPEERIEVSLLTASANTNADITRLACIGEDSTTTCLTTAVWNSMKTAYPITQEIVHTAFLRKAPAVGYHSYTWLEGSAATGTTTWRGVSGAGGMEQQQMGLNGSFPM